MPAVAPQPKQPKATKPKAPAVVKQKFSGQKKDKLGRNRCYSQGKLVKCAGNVATTSRQPGPRVAKASLPILPDDPMDLVRPRTPRSPMPSARMPQLKAPSIVKQPSKPAVPKPAAQIEGAFRGALTKTKGLSEDQRKTYGDGIAKAVSRMPPKALERLKKGIKAVSFQPDTGAIAKAVARDEPSVKAQFEEYDRQGVKYEMGGAYNRDGKLYLDGGMKEHANYHDTSMSNPHQVYAHELTHAIDGPNFELSTSDEWVDAWTSELQGGQLNNYATTMSMEGFAEFGRMVYASDRGAAEITKQFPKCAAFFRSRGLW